VVGATEEYCAAMTNVNLSIMKIIYVYERYGNTVLTEVVVCAVTSVGRRTDES
jgi:hypothetical protein